MSKGRSTTTTTQMPIIPDYLQGMQQEAFTAAREFSPEVFQGARFAPQNPFEAQQIQALSDFGGNAANVGQFGETISNIIGGGIGGSDLLRQRFDTPIDSQFLNQAINNRIADVTDSVTSQYARANRLGSDAFGDALGRGIGIAIAPTLAQQENIDAQRRDRLAAQIPAADIAGSQLQLRAAAQLPTVSALDLQRIGATGAAGELQRTADTRPIVADLQRIEQENLAEQARLNALLAAAGAGTVGIGQSQTSLEPPPSFAQTLLGVGSIASGLGGQGGLLGFLGG